MKLPKAPKGVPKKLPSKPPPFKPRPTRPQPISIPPQTAPIKPSTAPPKPDPIKYRMPPLLPRTEPTAEEIKAFQKNARVNRWRRFALTMSGLAVFGIGMYGTLIWISLMKEPDSGDVPYDLSDRFDKEADGYDEKVNMAERLLMLKSKRKAIMQRARGHVLEAAVGTGRNFQYYPTKKCETVTLLDASAPMLAVAKRKWKETHPEFFNRVFFKQQSALEPITPPYGAQDGYDTVIQTMGVCSTPEPVRLLRTLGAATKEGGQILLLEHGKSHYQWLNNLLDKTAPAHANEHGCWWNKDIGKIVEESGLEVVEIKRYNYGTTWWVELKPRKGMRSAGAATATGQSAEEPREPPTAPVVAQKAWWSLWR